MDFTKTDIILEEAKMINWNGMIKELTFMDIAGFPHYENVCSNILAFFFRTDAEHGMKDLLLRAMLNVINLNANIEYETIDVYREMLTDSGKRIDLVVETDDFVMAIENKIWATLYNDLDDYSNHLKKIYPKIKQYKIVLSLIPTKSSLLTNDFINITYPLLLDEIDNLMGQYWRDAHPKYLIMLNDFIKNLRKLIGGNEMNQEIIDYFKKNNDAIQSLMVNIKDYKFYLRSKLTTLAQSIDLLNLNKQCKQRYYRESDDVFDVLVHDITIGDAMIAIDTILSSGEYSIEIWLRNPGLTALKNNKDLVDFLVVKGIVKDDLKLKDNKYVYGQTESDQKDVVSILNDLIKKLCF